MSDLQCPARFAVVSAPDSSTAESLRHERVAAVYDGSSGPGAALLGEVLGLAVQALQRPLSLPDVLAHDPEALGDLRDLADLHRGETVVVTAVGGSGDRVDVEIDGDGARIEEVSREAGT